MTDLRGKKNCGARFAPGANAAKIREFFANSRRCRRNLLWLAVASRESGWSRNRNHFRGFATLVCLRFVVFIFVSPFSGRGGILICMFSNNYGPSLPAWDDQITLK